MPLEHLEVERNDHGVPALESASAIAQWVKPERVLVRQAPSRKQTVADLVAPSILTGRSIHSVSVRKAVASAKCPESYP